MSLRYDLWLRILWAVLLKKLFDNCGSAFILASLGLSILWVTFHISFGHFRNNALRWDSNLVFLISHYRLFLISLYIFQSSCACVDWAFFRVIFHSYCIALTFSSFNRGVVSCNFGFLMEHVHSNNWWLVC